MVIDMNVEPDVVIESDKSQIVKILTALIDNAIKYTDKGGDISVSLKKQKRHAACVVRNSGAGIPQEELPLVFDRFYRGDPARSS